MVAPATYNENLTINTSLNVIGSDAQTTIIDGGSKAPVFIIPSSCEEEIKGNGHVTLSNMTIRNGTNIEFRTEFFNLFNRTQFGFLGTTFNPSGGNNAANGFGVVTSSLGNPRLIQFALKFNF